MALSLPTRYNDPSWGQVFATIEDEHVDAACLAWFEQWVGLAQAYTQGKHRFLECAPMLHVLSNRTDAPMDKFIDALEKHDRGDVLWTEGYMWARQLFTAAVTARGWRGIALRCWTDPRGYAGYLQYIEQQGLYECVDDLALASETATKLSEALALYGDDLRYPWIAAACIRLALFGNNLTVADVPPNVRWLKERYTMRQKTVGVEAAIVLAQPLDFGQEAPSIRALLDSPDVWLHMLLQEGSYQRWYATCHLWLHWASSVGHPHLEEVRQALAESEFLRNPKQDRAAACERAIQTMLQTNNTELELMRLMGTASFLIHYAKRHHVPQSMALPEMESNSF